MKTLIVLAVAILTTAGFVLHYGYTHPTPPTPKHVNHVVPIPTNGGYRVGLRDNVVYDSGRIKHL